MHSRFCHYTRVQDKHQLFKDSKVENKSRIRKMTESQNQRPKVKCEGEALENVFKFKYLGSIFAADTAKCSILTEG